MPKVSNSCAGSRRGDVESSCPRTRRARPHLGADAAPSVIRLPVSSIRSPPGTLYVICCRHIPVVIPLFLSIQRQNNLHQNSSPDFGCKKKKSYGNYSFVPSPTHACRRSTPVASSLPNPALLPGLVLASVQVAPMISAFRDDVDLPAHRLHPDKVAGAPYYDIRE